MIFANVLFTLVFTISSPISYSKFIKVPALGRLADVGEFYDAYTNTFLHLSAFQPRIPSYGTSLVPSGSYFSAVTILNEDEDKAIVTEIGTDIEIDSFLGQINLEGSAAFLRKFKLRSTRTNAVLQYKRTTCVESINIGQPNVTDAYKPWLINIVRGTHLVHSIIWGVKCYAGIHMEKKSKDVEEGVRLEIASEFNALTAAVNSNNTYKANKNFTYFNSEIYSDVPVGLGHARSLDEVYLIIKGIDLAINSSFSQKGAPLYYILAPIREMNEAFGNNSTVCPHAGNDTRNYDMSENIKRRLNVLYQQHKGLVSLYKESKQCFRQECVPTAYKDQLDITFNAYKMEFEFFKEKMAGLVEKSKIERTETTENETISFISAYSSGANSPTSVTTELKAWIMKCESKANNHKILTSAGAVYIPKTWKLDQWITEKDTGICFVLIVKENWTSSPVYYQQVRFFKHLIGNKYVGDCDHGNLETILCDNTNSVDILMYTDGKHTRNIQLNAPQNATICQEDAERRRKERVSLATQLFNLGLASQRMIDFANRTLC